MRSRAAQDLCPLGHSSRADAPTAIYQGQMAEPPTGVPPLSANMTETPAPLGITVGRCEVRTHDGRERRDEIQWDSCPRTGG